MSLKLLDVYIDVTESIPGLYNLLLERSGRDDINISHRKVPTFEEHSAFVRSRPYAAWYWIMVEGASRGVIYLTKQDEIGVHVWKDRQGRGIGPAAVEALMAVHKRPRYFANINPANHNSIRMFHRLGFGLVQNTYAKEGN